MMSKRLKEMTEKVRASFDRWATITTWLIGQGLKYSPEGQPEEDRPMSPEAQAAGLSVVPATFQEMPLPFIHVDLKDDSDEACVDAGMSLAKSVETVILRGWKGEGRDTGLEVKGLFNYPRVAPLANIEAGLECLRDRHYYGPFACIHPHGQEPPDGHVMPLLRHPLLAPNELVLFQYTPDVIQMIVAYPVKVVPWGAEGKFKALCVIAPQIRADFRQQVGIAIKAM